MVAHGGGWIVEGVSTQDRLEINWINTAGGALGAVSSAVVLSTFGAAGTLAGAAVGSLCISVGGAVYAHSMRKTKDRVAAVASGSVARKGRVDARQMVTPAGTPAPPRVVDSPSLDGPTLDAPTLDAPTQRPDKDGLPWKRIAVMAGSLFGIALAAIVAFELSTGRAVSTYTGGTSDSSVGSTFSGVTDSQGGGDDSQDEEGDPKDTAPDDDQQNDEPAQDEPAQDELNQAPAQDEAPAEEAPAPAEEVPAPAEEVPAPAEEVPAPAEEVPAPAEEAPAPAEEAPAPQEQP